MHRPRNVIHDGETKFGCEHGEISGKLVTLDLILYLIQNVSRRSLVWPVWQIQHPSEAIKVVLEFVKKETQEKQELFKID